MEYFYSYLKDPLYIEKLRLPKFEHFIFLGMNYLLFTIPIGTIMFVTIKIFGIEAKPIISTTLKKILVVGLLGPIIEETLFRLILIFNKRNVIIVLLTCCFLALYSFFRAKPERVFILSISALILIISLFQVDMLKNFIQMHFKLFFYSIAILFASIHIYNFSGITQYNFFISPFLVLPQLFLGLILGYIRVNFGFVYCILFHATINLIGIWTII